MMSFLAKRWGGMVKDGSFYSLLENHFVMWGEHTLFAASDFYSVKGKHLLLTDYIWQAYVSDT